MGAPYIYDISHLRVNIIGITSTIYHAEGQAGPHYCSRRTVLVCTKERACDK